MDSLCHITGQSNVLFLKHAFEHHINGFVVLMTHGGWHQQSGIFVYHRLSISLPV